MRPRTYRRVSRALFGLLFLIFFLLYLLLREQMGAGPNGGWGGDGILTKDLGVIQLSEVRSGGFIIDEFPMERSTRLDDGGFNEAVVLCRAELHNEGKQSIRVLLSVNGSDSKTGADTHGLCGSYYYDRDDGDPVAGNYQDYLTQGEFEQLRYDEARMTLWIPSAQDPAGLVLEPDETVYLRLFFWADADSIPTLTETRTEKFSVTVKLTSRAVPQ